MLELPENIKTIIQKTKEVTLFNDNDKNALFQWLINPEEGTRSPKLINDILMELPIDIIPKRNAKDLIDIICSAMTHCNNEDLKKALCTICSDGESCLFLFTKLCTKAEDLSALKRINNYLEKTLEDLNIASEIITDWSDKAILTPQDLINKYVKDKHAEFSAWKAVKFLGTVAGCALFVWGNVKPVLKENQKLNALFVCLGLSAVVVSGFSSYFFKVDPSSHGVPNELYTGR